MKAILLLFDSLNRRFLEPYGCTETATPNFTRLAARTAQFESCYAGSLPCIPARRELHTGRYNFLHRSWGPMEPFDDSLPRILDEHGIHSHLVSDHGHYWECGGATYHTQYTTWEAIRGQEGDAWEPVVGGAEDPSPNFTSFTEGLRARLYRQNLANRTRFTEKQEYPLVRTFDEGLRFLENNGDKDGWFLHLESFSPHEPFLSSPDFQRLYGLSEKGTSYAWPDYAPVKEDDETLDRVRRSYFASLSMCDEQLGRLLDCMDKLDLWKDTLLIVNTDHGYLLGEHGYWAKNYMPCYDELVHLPLFLWDPRAPQAAGKKRESLVQTIDLPVTILDFFGIPPTSDMQGRPLLPVIAEDRPVREFGLFGMFGGELCCTDGRYAYLRAPRDVEEPLYEYTLMPTHMMQFFSPQELATMQRHDGFLFTKGLPVMQIQTSSQSRCTESRDLLFDLRVDPLERQQVQADGVRRRLEAGMLTLMRENDAPGEAYRRFAFSPPED